MNILFEQFSVFINEQILTPVVNHLHNKGYDVSLQELQGVVAVRVTNTVPQQVMPSITSLPTGIVTNPMSSLPRTSVSMPTMNGVTQSATGTCVYKFTKSAKDPNRICGKPCVPGTTYCKACWTKQTVQKEAKERGIPIPQVVVDAQANKTTRTTATVVRTTTMNPFPLPTANLPTGLPTFNPTMGRIQMPLPLGNTVVPPTAPVQSNNPYQVTNTQDDTNMGFLDERMQTLGMIPAEWGVSENYLIGANNIVYIGEGEGNDLLPTKYVGILDLNTKTFRALMEHEMALALDSATYDPSMLPVKQTASVPVQPTLPMVLPSSTVGVPKLPTTLPRMGLPPILQPPKSNIIASNDDE